MGTTQEDVKEPAIYLYKLEQLKLCNLSYIREYEQKFRKYAILDRVNILNVYYIHLNILLLFNILNVHLHIIYI